MDRETIKIKICLLGATFSTNNMGVNALTDGAIRCILNKYPEAQIYLLDYGEKQLVYDIYTSNGFKAVSLINMRFSKRIYLKNNVLILIFLALLLRIIPFEKIRQKIISKNYYLQQIYSMDIFASIAGGDSFSDIYGIRNLLYVSLPQFLVIFARKKLVVLPQTLGPFNTRIARFMAKYILQKAEAIYSRDHTSIKESKQLLGDDFNYDKIRFCYDMGFVVESLKPAKIDLDNFFEIKQKHSKVIGFNISGLLFMGGYTKNNMFKLKLDYKKLVYKIIDLLIRDKNSTILLIPHVFGDLHHEESDSNVCEKIYNELKPVYSNKIFCVHGIYNHNEIKYIIGMCDIFIGSRMHACIGAISQYIPTVAVAYSKKFFGVMQSLGLESCVADLRQLEQGDIVELINNIFNNQGLISAKLKTKIPEVQTKLFNLFENF